MKRIKPGLPPVKCRNSSCKRIAESHGARLTGGYCAPCFYRRQARLLAARAASEEMQRSLEKMRMQVSWMESNNLLPEGEG